VSCAPGCPNSKLNNTICNTECNTLACGFDDGDCPTPDAEELQLEITSDKRNSYKSNLDHSNLLLNRKLGYRARKMIPHMPLFFDRTVLLGTLT